MTWDEELDAIIAAARLRNVDPLFVAAIRKAENGGPGRQFGILGPNAPQDYLGQLAACCATVRNRLVAYPDNPFVKLSTAQPPRLIYAPAFIAWFGQQYAPSAADNDPTNLNANWVANVGAWYTKLLEGTA